MTPESDKITQDEEAKTTNIREERDGSSVSDVAKHVQCQTSNVSFAVCAVQHTR